jgi:hypothetical protein
MIEYKNVLTICPYCGTGCALNLQVLDKQVGGCASGEKPYHWRGGFVHQRLECSLLCQPQRSPDDASDPQKWRVLYRSYLGRGTLTGSGEVRHHQRLKAGLTALRCWHLPNARTKKTTCCRSLPAR